MAGYGQNPMQRNTQNPMAYLTMLAVFSQPGMDRQLNSTISMLNDISNILRTLRNASDVFHNNIQEAQMQMLSLPEKYSNPNGKLNGD